MIYLDNAATTQIAPEVFDAMLPYLKDNYGNAGSIYKLGRQSAEAIEKARRQVADFIGATPEQIIFTSGGTESNNLAILGSKAYLERINKKRIVTSGTEHDSVLKSIDALCRNTLPCNDEKCIKQDFYTAFLPVDHNGFVSPSSVHYELINNNDVGLVSVMSINNEIGTINDINSIGEICDQYGVLFHTDCVQAAGVIQLDVNKIKCDLMSISSHKIHGPKGVGALYVRDKTYLSAILNGGRSQEFGYRGGTENVAGIVGFGAACERTSIKYGDNTHKLIDYKVLFCRLLKQHLKEFGLETVLSINGIDPSVIGKTLSLTFNGVDAETLVLLMDAKGVCISAGSACQSRESKPSHVLTAIGLSEVAARNTVRVSFSEYNTIEEITKAAKTMSDCVRLLKDKRWSDSYEC